MTTKDRTTPVPDLAGCTREEKIRRMEKWFFQNFEDPAERTPYESAEGGYVYIWGVVDAREELTDRFIAHPHSTHDILSAVVKEIEEEGTEWVPVPHPSDYE